MDGQNSERRVFPRFNLLVDISVCKRNASVKENLLLTKNISQGGVCIIAYEEYKHGDLLDLNIHLPNNDDLKLIGRVTWVREFSVGDTATGKRFDVGVEFIGINDETFERINKYIFSHKEAK